MPLRYASKDASLSEGFKGTAGDQVVRIARKSSASVKSVL